MLLFLPTEVLQLAWKDSQIVLFMTTVSDGSEHVSRVRKRPTAKDKWIREAFGDQPFKRLEIPDFIDLYNHFMNSMDRADQIRTYYRRNRKEYNHNLQRGFNLVGSRPQVQKKKKSGHLNFRTTLASELMAHSSSSKHTDLLDGYGVQTDLQRYVVERTCRRLWMNTPDTVEGWQGVQSLHGPRS
jgi:hypothetical protein